MEPRWYSNEVPSSEGEQAKSFIWLRHLESRAMRPMKGRDASWNEDGGKGISGRKSQGFLGIR
jgi:hypothetical protein